VSGSPTVVIVVVRSVVSSRCETATFPPLPHTRRSCVTIGCVNGGEAINVVTSKTPCTPPIGQSDTLDEVAFDQAAPGLVGLWLLALVCAPRRLLSATPMPLRASFSKAMMSDTTSLSYPSARP
jgi:hypothetical protein